MNPGDWAAMQVDLAAIRDDNPESIVIRRGATTLPGQMVRIAKSGRAGSRQSRSEGGSRAVAGVTVMGSPDLDIRVDDRFTVAGILYEISFVHPNRRSRTEAEAEAVE